MLKSCSVEQAVVGRLVGSRVLTRGEGAFEGLKVGLLDEGATVGLSEGLGVGLLVEGANVGLSEGLGVGGSLGFMVGALLPEQDPTTDHPCIQSVLDSDPGSNP